MPCCGALDGTRFLPCLRAALGLRTGGPGKDNVWDEAAHRALYQLLAADTKLQQSRGQTSAEIAAVAWGSEPETTGGYVMAYATSFAGHGSSYWSCIGIDVAAAKVQIADESGDYYDVALVAGSAASVAEGGEELGGIPTWVKVALGIGVLGGLALLAWWIWG